MARRFSKNGATHFVARHEDQLDATPHGTMNLARHKADFEASHMRSLLSKVS